MAPTIQSLEADGNPFVLFKFPNKPHIQGYYQNNSQTHRSLLSDAKGFVFSPFILKDEVLFISNHFSFEINHFQSPTAASQPIELPANGRNQVIEKVVHAKAAIARGIFEKLVLSHCFNLTYQRDTAGIFYRLVHQYPNAFVYYWSHPATGKWMGATPERLLKYDGTKLETMALAGTLSVNHPDSAWSTKEFHEQQLVTDSIVSAVSQTFDSSQISLGQREVVRAGDLKHLQTKVLVNAQGINLQKVVEVLHPTPAVGGIPTTSSTDYINRHEGYDRTFYTGFMGPIDGHEKADLYVNLRCAHIANNQIRLFAGAGITADSQPESEWQEICRKAQTFLKVL
jgi:isochorismate synthase